MPRPPPHPSTQALVSAIPTIAFPPLFPHRGRPAEARGRLALVTIMQFAEGLSDRQAADAVRSRIDWKYTLALELTDPGFDASVLSEFRGRLLAGQAEQVLFETLLTRFREVDLLKPRSRQHGIDPCARDDPDAQPPGMCRGDRALRPGRNHCCRWVPPLADARC